MLKGGKNIIIFFFFIPFRTVPFSSKLYMLYIYWRVPSENSPEGGSSIALFIYLFFYSFHLDDENISTYTYYLGAVCVYYNVKKKWEKKCLKRIQGE